jgi:hypothetical protein
MGLLGNSQVTARHGGGPIERFGVDSVGDDRQPPGIEAADIAAEAQHALRDADGAGGQERRQAIEHPMPSLPVLGYPKTPDHPRSPGPGRRQPGRQVGMEQEALYQLGPVSAQRLGQPRDDLHGPAPAAGQALARKARLADNFGQGPFRSLGDDQRRPATSVQPCGQVHQRPLGTADIQVGDDQGNANRAFRSGTGTGSGKAASQGLHGDEGFLEDTPIRGGPATMDRTVQCSLAVAGDAVLPF